MSRLTTLLCAIATCWVLGIESSAAEYEGPWCFHMQLGRDFVSRRCDFRTYEACRAEMNALSGTYCTQNPYYWWNRPAEPPPRKVKRRIKRHR